METLDALLRNKRTIFLFLAPALLLYIVLVVFSIANAIYNSFFSWDMLSPKQYVGLRNYIRMFTNDSVFRMSVTNIGFILVVSLALQQIGGFILAVLLTGKLKGRLLLKNIFFVPAVISSVAVGLMWSFVYHPRVGLLNTLLEAVGLGSWTNQWLWDERTALWAVTIVTSWQFVGYAMILFIAAIQNIPNGVMEAARIDGASGFALIRYITIPLVKPMVKVNTILISIGTLKFFDLIYAMTGGGPAHRTEVLASYVYIRSFKQFEYGYGNALSVILLLLCLVVTIFVQKAIRTEEIEY